MGGLPKKPESISETDRWRGIIFLALFEGNLLKLMQPNDPLLWTFALASDPCSCRLLLTFDFSAVVYDDAEDDDDNRDGRYNKWVYS